MAYTLGGRRGSFAGSASLRIVWERDEPDALEWRLGAQAPAFLIVADMNFPGWSARLDGRPVPIRSVNLLFRGVEIPAGGHRLSMRYTPPGWWVGAWLTRLSALAGLVAFVLAGRRSPRDSAPA